MENVICPREHLLEFVEVDLSWDLVGVLFPKLPSQAFPVFDDVRPVGIDLSLWYGWPCPRGYWHCFSALSHWLVSVPLLYCFEVVAPADIQMHIRCLLHCCADGCIHSLPVRGAARDNVVDSLLILLADSALWISTILDDAMVVRSGHESRILHSNDQALCLCFQWSMS